ncbi:MAG: hypothetical protein A3K10_09215 [Bacteroidetes bacterium RIFCSPLOWO2_12_FULL_31_6]|nr:MAG: hypothetical protein A3K10_09215 [Bacteroidetes bacterium RIFCSPLOWO2_12_FULL_31_6]
MGFFDKLKASIGIGQPELSIKLDSNQVKAGTSIKGTITLTGKSRDIPVEKLLIEFLEVTTRREWNSATKSYMDKKTEQVLGKLDFPKNNQVLKVGESMTESFTLAVSPVTFSGNPYSHKVKASADLPGLDPRKTEDVFIV